MPCLLCTRKRWGRERILEALEAAQREQGVGDVDDVVEGGRLPGGAGLNACIGGTDESTISGPLGLSAANGLRYMSSRAGEVLTLRPVDVSRYGIGLMQRESHGSSAVGSKE